MQKPEKYKQRTNMNITTKANIGDTIFFMECNKVTSEEVKHIKIEISNKQHLYTEKTSISTLYYTNNESQIYEKDVFLSKQNLLDNL